MRTKTEERMPFPWSVKEPLLAETKGRCARCGTPLDRYTNLTVDHFIPLSKGGSNEPWNLTVLCEGCNDEKADMVLDPVQWYALLPMSRRKDMRARLDQYMKDTDYLAEDCLMPLDDIRIEVSIETSRRTHKGCVQHIDLPAYIHGTKMQGADAFAWLQEYAKSLQYREFKGLMKSPDEFYAPCYLMKKGDIEVAMANPWLLHEWEDRLGTYRNEIFMDWYFAPGLPDRPYLPKMLSQLVQGMERSICRSISSTMEGACMVMMHTRCFYSDRFCVPVFDLLTYRRGDQLVEYETGYSLMARIRDLTAFHMMGSREACDKLEKELAKKNQDRCIGMSDAMQLNQAFNDRLDGKKQP